MEQGTSRGVSCSVDATIQEAARLMAQYDRPELTVVDAYEKPIGVITERDIARRAVAAGKVPITAVRQVMSRFGTPGEGPNPAVDDDEGACCGMLPGRRGP